MTKYRVMCMKYGWAVVEAENGRDAEEIAKSLPDSDYDWSDADDYQVVEEVDY